MSLLRPESHICLGQSPSGGRVRRRFGALTLFWSDLLFSELCAWAGRTSEFPGKCLQKGSH